jgi:pimeloyl-ACP methyl ester carboxylesterase
MIADVETRTVHTRDGRELCVEIAGGPAERSVLVHCGTPNSRHLYDPWIEDATVRGVQLISYDRPGYGGSTPQAGHTVGDAAGDVQAIAEDLGLEQLAVWGFSGGGPYTLASAALLPELVVAAAIVGSIAPWEAPGLDWFKGMGQDNFDDINLYLSDPEASRTKARQDWEETLAVTPEALAEAWKTLLSPVDAAVVTGAFAEYIVRSIHDGLAPGDQGWWDDGVAHLAPWGFDLESIRIPVKVWHGHEDRFVPFQHGQWLAEHVPGAESYLSEADGHLTLLVERYPDVHEWLASKF